MNLRIKANLSQSSLFVLIVVIFQFRTVQNMVKISLNSNANSVALQPNGFVGGILISVSLAISVNVMEIM